MPETLTPGCHIDSHWGHYQSQRILEIAYSLGWPDPEPKCTSALQAKYPDLDPETSDMEIWQETVEAAEEWINDNCVPEGHWFGHHPDLGDVGVWLLDDHCDQCYHPSDCHTYTAEAPCTLEGCECETLSMEV